MKNYIVKTKNSNIKKVLIAYLTVLSILNLSGCSEKVNCEIEELHAHLYTTEDGYENYFISNSQTEKQNIRGYERQEDYIIVFKDKFELIKFENKNHLINIEENKEVLEDLENSLIDYKQYQYRYTTVTSNGKTSQVHTHYSWTNNPNHSGLTGKERTMTHLYYGYKIIETKNSSEEISFKIEKSKPALSIKDLINTGYTYVKEDSIYSEIDIKYLDENSLEPTSDEKILKYFK